MSQDFPTVDNEMNAFVKFNPWRGNGAAVFPEAVQARLLGALGHASISMNQLFRQL